MSRTEVRELCDELIALSRDPRSGIHGLLRSLPRADREEVVQDVCADLLRCPPPSKPRNIEAYLFTVIKNRHLGYAEAAREEQQRLVQGTDCVQDVPADGEDDDVQWFEEGRDRFDEILKRMESVVRHREYARILRLEVVENLSLNKIAERLGTSEETVGRRARRAHECFRKTRHAMGGRE